MIEIDVVLAGLEEDFGRLLARQIISVRLLRLELDASRARVRELEAKLNLWEEPYTTNETGANVGG